MSKVIIIGPAHPLRGGLATFDHRLAKEFVDRGDDCSIYSFSLQYPNFLFPGKTQYTDEPVPAGIKIVSAINSINPLNWISVGNRIKKENPDIIVVRFWLPFMGPALGTILRRVKKNSGDRRTRPKIICVADNVIPHEHRPGDKTFTKYFIKSCDAFITMSEQVMADLRTFERDKPAKLIQHPLYDNFGAPVPKAEAREKLKIRKEESIILFFGFIRKYKGLDILLDAMKLVKANTKSEIPNPKLVIAGEFYEDEKPYLDQINKLGIRDSIILKTEFIPDSEVKYYLSAADAVVQPYRNATQSGVTPLAYHFEKPMIVTNVGGLPSLVPNEKAGLVAEPNATSLAAAIQRFYQLGEDYFLPHLRSEKQKYSWGNLVDAVFELADREK
ncbi:MAG TPA: glycosyltransferase [Chitinophagaceae bacterium]|nr:glycosyltransferase [Chitinophagaceae bacterium]